MFSFGEIRLRLEVGIVAVIHVDYQEIGCEILRKNPIRTQGALTEILIAKEGRRFQFEVNKSKVQLEMEDPSAAYLNFEISRAQFHSQVIPS